MRYENEPCCSCGKLLQPKTDDIVVCPDCGAPQHRHCWLEAGKCAFAEKHEAGFAWASAAAPREEAAPQPASESGQPGIICPTCGEGCPQGATYCENCGTDFNEYSSSLHMRLEQEQLRREQYIRENFPTYRVNGRDLSMGDTLAGQPVEEIVLQLRASNWVVTRYLRRFEKNRRVGWNWAAFILGPYWYFFRKLYKPAILFAGLLLALTIGFTPMNNQLTQRVFGNKLDKATSYSEQISVINDVVNSPELSKAIHDYRWQLAAYCGLQLLLHAAMGLLADPLLKRKLWSNIEYVHQEGDTAVGINNQFGRHQALLRLGGFSVFAPALYFFSLDIIPRTIISLITWITG